MSSSLSSADSADPWSAYSRVSDGRARGDAGRLYWYRRIGPGSEILGPVAGRTVADHGCGTGREAAYVAGVLGAARVLAVDTSGAQIARGRELRGHVPALQFVHADVTTTLRAAPASFDVAYSHFGAADFTDPRRLLPAVATALRPGGTFVLATLAHYKGGRAAESGIRPGTIRARHDDGTGSAMGVPVWERLLGEAEFTDLVTDILRDPGTGGEPPMATTLVRATRR